jgi:hypothetical protein
VRVVRRCSPNNSRGGDREEQDHDPFHGAIILGHTPNASILAGPTEDRSAQVMERNGGSGLLTSGGRKRRLYHRTRNRQGQNRRATPRR